MMHLCGSLINDDSSYRMELENAIKIRGIQFCLWKFKTRIFISTVTEIREFLKVFLDEKKSKSGLGILIYSD